MPRFRRPSQVLISSLLLLICCSVAANAQSHDQIAPTLIRARHSFTIFGPKGHRDNSISATQKGFGFDSLQTFTGSFQASGVGPTGVSRRNWYYTMAGGAPGSGGTTRFDAPIVPVSLDLLDYDGSVRVVNGQRLHYSVQPFVNLVLDSPVFQNASYTSSDVPTQFVDAIQRAQFYNRMQQDWHTLLRPEVKTERTLAVPRGSYFFALKNDGSCCAFVLIDINVFASLMFPASPSDTKTPVGAAEHSGDIRTQDISTFLFPNTYLYFNRDPNQCCVLGFHTYDFEPGDAANGFREKRFVLSFASWISPGVFGSEFEDVTALSHEMTESINDPFVGSDGVHGITPWWLSPNGNCQNDVEPGDVIEGLPDATIAITTKGRVYHPQNEALLPWLKFESPSTAIGGAYSYPNMSVLTSLSPPQGMNCK